MSSRSLGLWSIITMLFLVFLGWVIRVALPVAAIELRYQYKKVLTDVFHTPDIRSLILPNFRIDFKGFTSRNTIDGLTIPAIYLDEPVVYNVDPNDEKAYTKALKKGIAHASATALPGTGGLGYYFAHSSSPSLVSQYNAVFYLLGKLKKGDEVYIWREGKRTDYAVTQTVITTANDVSFLQKTYDTETVVLQTCWPPGTTAKRLLVFAERIL